MITETITVTLSGGRLHAGVVGRRAGRPRSNRKMDLPGSGAATYCGFLMKTSALGRRLGG